MLLIHQFDFSKIRLLKIKSILKIRIISIGISGDVSAQSLDEYCLSAIGKIEATNKNSAEDPTRKMPSFIGSVENLPELYSQPCNKLYRFFGEVAIASLNIQIF